MIDLPTLSSEELCNFQKGGGNEFRERIEVEAIGSCVIGYDMNDFSN